MKFSNGNEVKETGVSHTVEMDDDNVLTFFQYGAYVDGKLIATVVDAGGCGILIDIAKRGFIRPEDKFHFGGMFEIVG